jgi:hypothetical protein
MDLLRESNPELYDRISTRTDPLFLRLLGPEPEFHRLVFTERIGDLHLVREMRDFRNEYEIKNRRELIEFLVNQILESRSKKIRKACCVFLLMVSFVKNLWWCEMQDHEAFDALKQHRLIADAFEWVRMDENLGDRILPYYCVTRKQDFDVIYGSLSEYYDFDAQKRLPGFDEQLGIELGMSYIGSDFGKQTVNRLSFHLTFETPRDNADVFAEVAAYYSEEEHLQLRKLYIDKTVWAQNVNEFFQQVFDD